MQQVKQVVDVAVADSPPRAAPPLLASPDFSKNQQIKKQVVDVAVTASPLRAAPPLLASPDSGPDSGAVFFPFMFLEMRAICFFLNLEMLSGRKKLHLSPDTGAPATPSSPPTKSETG
jgi:hypothetical protein